MTPEPVVIREYVVNVKTGTVHRDPGCTRIVMGRAANFITTARYGGAAKTCAYCWSRAGFRRYP